ncbi:MAG: hypothetical protein NC240_07230 [Clostridium sp.]|nr:hypothetical protein [Clostridium sp.]
MKRNPVIVKGNNTGIKLIMDDDASVEEVIEELKRNFKTSGLKPKISNPITVTFEGKTITEDEKTEIYNFLNYTGLNIVNQKKTTEIPKEINKIPDEKDGLFYIGTLKSGQALDAEESIIIIGDIEAGATVTSKGNVVVIGHMNGYIKSGCDGRSGSFIYGLFQEGL